MTRLILLVLLLLSGCESKMEPVRPPVLTVGEAAEVAKLKPGLAWDQEISTTHVCWRNPKSRVEICWRREQ